ncbi:hypothetical protein WL29_22275 [Burkholderia ubonensis]|uniref:Uncharacterized protein n=1 Tax=Burkholderia ubonensis TaxID=101571 RepID=A0A106QCU7_9BURK|nr:hypothetical protein WL29_22275 [Burkholderia ubonensis]
MKATHKVAVDWHDVVDLPGNSGHARAQLRQVVGFSDELVVGPRNVGLAQAELSSRRVGVDAVGMALLPGAEACTTGLPKCRVYLPPRAEIVGNLPFVRFAVCADSCLDAFRVGFVVGRVDLWMGRAVLTMFLAYGLSVPLTIVGISLSDSSCMPPFVVLVTAVATRTTNQLACRGQRGTLLTAFLAHGAVKKERFNQCMAAFFVALMLFQHFDSARISEQLASFG